jgi:AraC-like DNA-binding protein
VTAAGGTDWLLSMDGVDTGHCSSTEVVLPAHLRYAVGGHGDQDNVVISTVTAGRVAFERHQPARQQTRLDRYRTGDTYIGNQPHALANASTHHVQAKIVTMSRSVLAEAATQFRGHLAEDERSRPSQPAAVPTFTTMAPAGVEAARQWRRTTRYVEDTLAEAAAERSPLLIAAMDRLLATTALAVFPNTLTAGTTIEDRRDAHPETLRRSVAFIEANPDVDITISDIARAAFVSPRTVQLTFRRHLGTTPLAYLRTVRLEQAHRQLQDASSGDGTTVAGVAARWGLTPSRFTEHYQATYGVLPSHTLRS